MNHTWPDASSPSPWGKSTLLQSCESHLAGRLLPLSLEQEHLATELYESHLAGHLPPPLPGARAPCYRVMNHTWPDASPPSPWSKSTLLQSYESHLAGRLLPLSLEQKPLATEL